MRRRATMIAPSRRKAHTARVQCAQNPSRGLHGLLGLAVACLGFVVLLACLQVIRCSRRVTTGLCVLFTSLHLEQLRTSLTACWRVRVG